MLPDDAPADWNRPFLNLVAHCRSDGSRTTSSPLSKQIERALGREDHGRWAPRPIDLDLLLYGTARRSRPSGCACRIRA